MSRWMCVLLLAVSVRSQVYDFTSGVDQGRSCAAGEWKVVKDPESVLRSDPEKVSCLELEVSTLGAVTVRVWVRVGVGEGVGVMLGGEGERWRQVMGMRGPVKGEGWNLLQVNVWIINSEQKIRIWDFSKNNSIALRRVSITKNKSSHLPELNDIDTTTERYTTIVTTERTIGTTTKTTERPLSTTERFSTTPTPTSTTELSSSSTSDTPTESTTLEPTTTKRPLTTTERFSTTPTSTPTPTSSTESSSSTSDTPTESTTLDPTTTTIGSNTTTLDPTTTTLDTNTTTSDPTTTTLDTNTSIDPTTSTIESNMTSSTSTTNFTTPEPSTEFPPPVPPSQFSTWVYFLGFLSAVLLLCLVGLLWWLLLVFLLPALRRRRATPALSLPRLQVVSAGKGQGDRKSIVGTKSKTLKNQV